jgi:hypothetical protein
MPVFEPFESFEPSSVESSAADASVSDVADDTGTVRAASESWRTHEETENTKMTVMSTMTPTIASKTTCDELPRISSTSVGGLRDPRRVDDEPRPLRAPERLTRGRCVLDRFLDDRLPRLLDADS